MAKIRLLGQPHGTWVSLETLKFPQGTWISYEAPGSASRFLDQLRNTLVNLKVFRSATEYLGQLSREAPGSAMEHLGQS
jgi:hypothetical protein